MVWFKQLQAFWCTPPADKTEQDLESALAKQVIGECPSTSTLSYGWEHPLNATDGSLLITVGRFHCAKFSVAKRLLPLDVIRQTVADRVLDAVTTGTTQNDRHCRAQQRQTGRLSR